MSPINGLLVQGIMGILSGSLGPEFFARCYTPLGEVTVIIIIINIIIIIIIIVIAGDGHDDAGELHDQLHPLLHHVQAVQAHFQVKRKFDTFAAFKLTNLNLMCQVTKSNPT